MQTRIKKLAVLLVGWGFILLGLIGLFLPVLQGVLFLIIGLAILSSEYVWAHHLLVKIRTRFPTATSRWDKAAVRTHAWIRKVFRHTGTRAE